MTRLQIVYPAKVQEKQVEQLRTQVVDLERFVDFLQGVYEICYIYTFLLHQPSYEDVLPDMQKKLTEIKSNIYRNISMS